MTYLYRSDTNEAVPHGHNPPAPCIRFRIIADSLPRNHERASANPLRPACAAAFGVFLGAP